MQVKFELTKQYKDIQIELELIEIVFEPLKSWLQLPDLNLDNWSPF